MYGSEVESWKHVWEGYRAWKTGERTDTKQWNGCWGGGGGEMVNEGTGGEKGEMGGSEEGEERMWL